MENIYIYMCRYVFIFVYEPKSKGYRDFLLVSYILVSSSRSKKKKHLLVKKRTEKESKRQRDREKENER